MLGLASVVPVSIRNTDQKIHSCRLWRFRIETNRAYLKIHQAEKESSEREYCNIEFKSQIGH